MDSMSLTSCVLLQEGIDWDAGIEKFAGLVWSPMVIILLGAGVLFSLAMFFVQVRMFRHSVNVIRGKYDKPEDAGEISHFQALTSALSATVGLGNIAGVAFAVSIGGPGAVFWMWVAGFLGMGTKFVTCSLATMYREVRPDGTVVGGPMYAIEQGLGDKGRIWKYLAVAFAFFAAIASFGGGNMFQSNQAASIFKEVFGLPELLTGLVLTVLVGITIIGGIKRIGAVTSKLVPFMCVLYVVASLFIILTNINQVPDMIRLIFESAFSSSSAVGGFLGAGFGFALYQGVRRAVFSNEAGLGSAPMAHASAKTDEPIREGIVAMIGPFIDTIVICTMTALVLLITGAWKRPEAGTIASVETTITAEDIEAAKEDDAKKVDVRFTVTPAGDYQERLIQDRAAARKKYAAALVDYTNALEELWRSRNAHVARLAKAGTKQPSVDFPIANPETMEPVDLKKALDGFLAEVKAKIGKETHEKLLVGEDHWSAWSSIVGNMALPSALLFATAMPSPTSKEFSPKLRLVLPMVGDDAASSDTFAQRVECFVDVSPGGGKEIYAVAPELKVKLAARIDKDMGLHRDFDDIKVTGFAFEKSFGRIGSLVLAVGVFLFALSTIISWSYYGERGTEYLFGHGAVRWFRVVFVAVVFLGSLWTSGAVLNFSDAMLALMAFPNLVATVAFTPLIMRKLADYTRRLRRGDFDLPK